MSDKNVEKVIRNNEADKNILDPLVNRTLVIEKHVINPVDKIIQSSDSLEMNIKPENIKDWNVHIHKNKMENIHCIDHPNLNTFDKYRKQITVKEFNFEYKPFERKHINTNTDNEVVFGKPTILKDKTKGVSEYYENANTPVTNVSAPFSIPVSDKDKSYEEFLKLREARDQQIKQHPKDGNKIKEIFENKSKRLENKLNKNKPLVVQSVKPPPAPIPPMSMSTPKKPSSLLHPLPDDDEPITPIKRTNNKKHGEGFVREEADIINDVYKARDKNKKLDKIKDIVEEEGQIVKDVYRPAKKGKKIIFDEDELEDENENKTKNKNKIKYIINEEGKVVKDESKDDQEEEESKEEYHRLLQWGKTKDLKIKNISEIKILFDDDHINPLMTQQEIAQYMWGNYGLKPPTNIKIKFPNK